jgi:hypothetical protein
MSNSNVQETLLIVILSIIILILIFLIEIYRNILGLMEYYAPELKPPKDLDISQTFLKNNKKKG